MQRLGPEIAIVHDSSVNIDDVAEPLAKSFALEKQSLDDYVNRNPVSADLLVFFANPRSGSTYDLLKTALEVNESGKIFVLPTHNSDSISKLENLGIDDYLILPIEPLKLRTMLKRMLNQQVERSWMTLAPEKQRAL